MSVNLLNTTMMGPVAAMKPEIGRAMSKLQRSARCMASRLGTSSPSTSVTSANTTVTNATAAGHLALSRISLFLAMGDERDAEIVAHQNETFGRALGEAPKWRRQISR
jgi:hypothetical protein